MWQDKLINIKRLLSKVISSVAAQTSIFYLDIISMSMLVFASENIFIYSDWFSEGKETLRIPRTVAGGWGGLHRLNYSRGRESFRASLSLTDHPSLGQLHQHGFSSQRASELTPDHTPAVFPGPQFTHEASLPLCALAFAVLGHWILLQFSLQEESRKRCSLDSSLH